MKRRLLAMFLTCAMLIGCTACSSTEESASNSGAQTVDDGTTKIAFITKSMSDQFFIDAKEAAEAYAEELGIELTYLAPEGGQSDIEGEVQILEDSIIQGVDAIILDPSDTAAFNTSIKKANDTGIPVILFNDEVDTEDLESIGGHIDCYVGLNSVEAAGMVADYCIENSEPGKVAILEGVSGNTSSIDRVNGFKDVVEAAGFEVVASQPGNWDKNEAYNVTQNILTANPDISVIWACSSLMGMGAIQAIEDLGMTGQIDVYDFHCEADDIAAIKAGTLCATLRYPTAEWAELAVDTAMSLIDGEDVPEEVFTEVMVVTPENDDTLG